MVRVLNDLMKEGDIINQFLKTIKLEYWTKKIDFNNWIPWDIIGHLHYFDIISLVTLGEKNKFYNEKNMLIDAFNNGKMFIAQYFAGPPIDPPQVGKRWIIIQ